MTMTTPEDPKQLFDAGDLDGAVAAATDAVRKNPGEIPHRLFLAELLCYQGNVDRADRQLDVLTQQQPDAVVVLQFRQLLRAEKHRHECFLEGRAPEFLSDPPEHLQLMLKANLLQREGDRLAAADTIEEADSKRPQVSGTCDSTPFAGLRDLDDLSASFFEVLTSVGTYYWVPFESIDQIEFHAPAAPRDLIWRRASMSVHDGPDGEVFLPALYSGSATSDDRLLQLGRSTDWTDEDGPIQGIGQRTYLVGEDDRPILTIGSIDFDRA